MKYKSFPSLRSTYKKIKLQKKESRYNALHLIASSEATAWASNNKFDERNVCKWRKERNNESNEVIDVKT